MHDHNDGKSRLRRLVRLQQPTTPNLPFVHSTDAYVLAEIVAEKAISPQPCPVFQGEKLIYLFYGRPAFRPNMTEEATTLSHYFPVVLIFKPQWMADIKRIFPFDSGAFANDFYGHFIHKKMSLTDFGLEPDGGTPGKVISLFYGSNAAYLNATPQPVGELDPTEFEAHAYAALAGAKGANAVDSRGSGIEVQIDKSVELSDAVAAIVLPGQFATSQLGDAIKALDVEMLTYRVTSRSRPNEYMSALHDICLTYFARTGLIEGA